MNQAERIVKSTIWSAPGCHSGCGVLLHVKDGKLMKVEGDPNHPWNQGRLCPRSLALTQYVYHPDRLQYPMRRVGERGEGKWERITWEEALNEIEQKFKEIKKWYGGKAIVFGQGTARYTMAVPLLAWSLGSPNWPDLGLGGLSCYWPRLGAAYVTTGENVVMDAAQWFRERYDHPKYKLPETIVIWGNNPMATCPDGFMGNWVTDCMKRGSKTIVIDSRCNWLATRATLWLQPRPSTDGALALGFINAIISEKMYDEEFVESWTNAPHLIRTDTLKPLIESDVYQGGEKEGYYVWDNATESIKKYDSQTLSYEDPTVEPALEGSFDITLADGGTVTCKTSLQMLKERVSEYTPERVEEITWIPKEKIIQAAKLYARSKPAAIQWGLALDMGGESFRASQAITHLWTLTGNFDVPGGNVPARPAYGIMFNGPKREWFEKTLPMEMIEKTILGGEKFPMVKYIARLFLPRGHPDAVLEAMETGKPYPVKALWIQTNNFLACMAADPKRWLEAIRRLEFVVVVDTFLTPTAKAVADIVLPAVSYAERIGAIGWWSPISATCKAIEPIGEARSDNSINLEIAKRFNPDLRKFKDEEALLDEMLKPAGLDFKQFCDKHWAIAPEDHPSGCIPYQRYEKGLLRRDGTPGLRTLSGKLELYSYRLDEWGFDPLPFYSEPRPESPVVTPEIFKEYPLILGTGRRSVAFFHSEHRQIPWCREIDPDPIVEIHPETAKELSIQDGDWVWIENSYGKCRRIARLTPIVHKKTVMVPHGWWLPEFGPDRDFGVWDINVNQLIPMGYTSDTGWGGAPYKCMSCKIYKAEKGVY